MQAVFLTGVQPRCGPAVKSQRFWEGQGPFVGLVPRLCVCLVERQLLSCSS